jgi:hypothetical protein
MNELPSRTSSKILRASASAPDTSIDPYFIQIRDDLSDKGFFTATAEELITWGADRLTDVDDVWAGLLRGRDDADVDAAL